MFCPAVSTNLMSVLSVYISGGKSGGDNEEE